MKKYFRFYLVIWALEFLVYNLSVFFGRKVLFGILVVDPNFWFLWAMVVIAYLIQLLCAYIACKDENMDKVFLNIPLFKESCASVTAMTGACSALMLVPVKLPVGTLITSCVIPLIVNIIALVKAKFAGTIVSDIDDKVKSKRNYISSLVIEVESLITRSKNNDIKNELTKILDTIRYSDPMSNDSLKDLEDNITNKVKGLNDLINDDKCDEIKNYCLDLKLLIEERNKKCKLMK